MTSMIPESIIQKIMLYNSHPVADLLTVSEKFKKRKELSDIFNNDKGCIRCWECDEVIDWIKRDHLCVLCRRFQNAENEEERRYNGDLEEEADSEYDPDYEELEQLRLYG